jgi:hypothetical protein
VFSSLLWSLHIFSVQLRPLFTTLEYVETNDEKSLPFPVPSSRFVRSSSSSTARISIDDGKEEEEDPNTNAQGWKTIHVFYGDSTLITQDSIIPSDYFAVNKWFSQFRQDEVVSGLLKGKRDGYFVDLAANDAVRISNTYALETYFGWKGLCLEPNERYWSGLAYRKCDVVGAVVGDTTMDQKVAFKFPKEKAPKGGIVGEAFDNHDDGTTKEEIRQRYTITLKDIFERFNTPRVIDYLSLDVEGAELFIMRNFPFSDYQIKILTVERPNPELSEVLMTNGYILLKTLHANTETLWVHRSAVDSLDHDALKINSEKYKYREGQAHERIAPEELP